MAIADDGRDGEVRYLGEIDNSPDAVRKLVAKLSRQYERLHFCYEAGSTGYGLHRQLTDLGHVCDVVAPTASNRRGRNRGLLAIGNEPTLVGAQPDLCFPGNAADAEGEVLEPTLQGFADPCRKPVSRKQTLWLGRVVCCPAVVNNGHKSPSTG